MAKQISIVDVLRHSGKFNIVNIAVNVLSVPKSIIIAMVLTPSDYGVISFLGLWLMYAGLLNPGFLSARNREMAHFIGNNDEKQAVRIQNISHTSDLLYSVIVFLAIISASFFFSDPVLRIGIIITALSYAANHILIYWRGVNFVRQHFNLVAKCDLIKSVATVLIILVLVSKFKIYAVLAAPVIAAVFAGLYYWRKGKIGYRFLFDWPETLRLYKVGISFSILALAYWGYRLVDRTVVATFLSIDDLGIYSYASVFIFMGLSFLSDFGNVLTPVIWTKIGKAENRASIFYDIKRITVYLAISTAIMIPLAQICFYLLVQLITKKFLGSIPIFIVLSCNLYLTSLFIMPSMILQSSVVNKQALSLKIYIIGLVLNVILDLLAIRMGYGLLAISLITVVLQGLVTFAHFYFVRSYICEENSEFPGFMLSIAVPFLISIAFCLFHIYFIYNVISPLLLVGASLLFQIVIWFAMIVIFYREYFSKDKIIRAINEFIGFVSRLAGNLWPRQMREWMS